MSCFRADGMVAWNGNRHLFFRGRSAAFGSRHHLNEINNRRTCQLQSFDQVSFEFINSTMFDLLRFSAWAVSNVMENGEAMRRRPSKLFLGE